MSLFIVLNGHSLKNLIDTSTTLLLIAQFGFLLLFIEALPGGGGGTCFLFSLKKSAFDLVSQNQNLDFLCSLFPKIAFVPLFPSVLDFCSLIPLKYIALFPCSPKRLGGPLYSYFLICSFFFFFFFFFFDNVWFLR